MRKNNRYHIHAYKHFWVEGDPIPMPYQKDQRTFVIEAKSEKEALALAEREYGSAERIDPDTREYIKNPDGSWTLMGVEKIEIYDSV